MESYLELLGFFVFLFFSISCHLRVTLLSSYSDNIEDHTGFQ